jgi:hypothetical protein
MRAKGPVEPIGSHRSRPPTYTNPPHRNVLRTCAAPESGNEVNTSRGHVATFSHSARLKISHSAEGTPLRLRSAVAGPCDTERQRRQPGEHLCGGRYSESLRGDLGEDAPKVDGPGQVPLDEDRRGHGFPLVL